MLWQVPDIAMIGDAFVIDSLVKGETLNIPPSTKFVVTGGYYQVGDKGNAYYKRSLVEPNHWGKFKSLDGAWWELCSPIVNVNMFGAKGDGSDDAVFFQRALSYCSTFNLTLNLLEMTYSTGIIQSTVSINGNGATIKGYLELTQDDIIIDGLNIISTGNIYALYCHGSVVTPTFFNNYIIRNCSFTFDAGIDPSNLRCILASNITRLVIDNCRIDYAVELIGCAAYEFTNNYIDGHYLNNNELLHPSINSTGIISNNTFLNSLDNFLDLYSSGARTIVSNNRFIGCRTKLGTAIELKVTLSDNPNNTSSDANGWEEQIIISDNYFGNLSATSNVFTSIISVYYLDSRAVPVFSWADTPRNIIIADNIFDGFDTTNITSSYFSAIYLKTVNSVLVSNNIVRGITLSGAQDVSAALWIENCQDVIVSGNKFVVGGGTGITFQDVCTKISIDNNHITEDLKTAALCKYGIKIVKEGSRPTPEITYCSITNNTIRASTYGIFSPYNSLKIFSNNIVSENIIYSPVLLGNFSSSKFSNNKMLLSTNAINVTLGDLGTISAYNSVTGNWFESPVGSKGVGLFANNVRCSTVSTNYCKNNTNGIQFVGTNTAGELDYINVKDNYSITQSGGNFPMYSNMNAGDTATLQAVNNQKVT